MKITETVWSCSVAAIALGQFFAVPALAQSAPVADRSTAAPIDRTAETTNGGIGDIIVTARKRQESVQDVPVAVTAISAATIEKRDITSLEKIAAATPSLSVGRSSNGAGAQLTLRGIGSLSTSIGVEQSVATVVDGVYYGQGRIINEGFFDLAGVEVLKGPQALFFGKNATAGVISIKTADPTDHWEFKARTSYEFKAEQVQLEGVVSGPLSDTLGVRVAVRGSKMYGGYYDNVATAKTLAALGTTSSGGPFIATPAQSPGPGEKELLGRVTLKWEPDDRLTATLKASGSYNFVNNSSWNYVAYNCPGGVSAKSGFACRANFITHQNNMPREMAANVPYARDGELYNKYRSAAVTSTVDYKLDNVTFTSVTNYNWNNNQYLCDCTFQSNAAPAYVTENSSWKAFSSEARALTTFDGPLNLMLGVLYQRTKRDFDQFVSFSISNNPGAGANQFLESVKDSFTKGETIAAFTQLTYQVTPTLELAGGARYTHETKKSAFVQPYVSPAFSAVWVQGRTTTADQTWNDWSPEATITWKPVRDILVYGAFKTAYKSGGFSNGGIDSALGNPSVDLPFNREKARGFEAGVKTTLLDRQLRFNVGLYNYNYKDLQIDFFNGPSLAFQTLTAGARTKGVEVEFEYAPRAVEGLNLHGAINYNKARYTDFPLAPCYGGQTPAEGCNLSLTPGGPSTRQNLNGTPLSAAPAWTGSLGVAYDTSLSDTLLVGFNVDTRYSDKYLISGFGNPLSTQHSYATIDAGVRIGPNDQRWEIALIGKNLTNKLYFGGGNDAPSTGSGTGTPAGVHADLLGYGSVPRTVRLQGTVKF